LSDVSKSHGLGNSFAYPFRDPKWVEKLLIALLLMLANFIIPVIPALVLAGYAIEIMRIVLQEVMPALPAWKNWGTMLVDGLRFLGITILFFLPTFLIALLGFGAILIPTLMSGLLSTGQEEVTTTVVLLPILGSAGGVITLGLMSIVGIVSIFLLPPAIVHATNKEEFSAAFRIREWWWILRLNFSEFLIAYAIITAFNIITTVLIQFFSFTVVLCLVVPFLQSAISVYGMLFSAALIAKAYREGLQKLADT